MRASFSPGHAALKAPAPREPVSERAGARENSQLLTKIPQRAGSVATRARRYCRRSPCAVEAAAPPANATNLRSDITGTPALRAWRSFAPGAAPATTRSVFRVTVRAACPPTASTNRSARSRVIASSAPVKTTVVPANGPDLRRPRTGSTSRHAAGGRRARRACSASGRGGDVFGGALVLPGRL